MGRFYRTAQPVYLPNLAYQAPIELMLNRIQQDNQVRQVAEQKAQELSVLNQSHKYYDDPDNIEKERLAKIQSYYDNKINDQVNQIYNSTDYSKLKLNQSDISTDLLNNMRTGELSKIASRYAAWENLMNDYKEASVKDRVTADYVLQYELGQLNNAVKNNYDKYSPNKIITKPQLQKELTDMVKSMQANKQFQLSNGYIINTEYLDQNRLYQLALNELQSRPEYSTYVQQGIRVGMPGIVDDKGNLIQPYGYFDKNSNSLSQEEYVNILKDVDKYAEILNSSKSTAEEKEIAQNKLQEINNQGYYQGLNNKWLFYNDINKLGAFAYNQQDIKSDPVWLQKDSQQHDFAKMAVQQRYAKELIDYKNKATLELLQETGKLEFDADGNPVVKPSSKSQSTSKAGNTDDTKAYGVNPITDEAGNLFKLTAQVGGGDVNYTDQPQTDWDKLLWNNLQSTSKDDITKYFKDLSQTDQWKNQPELQEAIQKIIDSINNDNFVVTPASIQKLQYQLYDDIKKHNKNVIDNLSDDYIATVGYSINTVIRHDKKQLQELFNNDGLLSAGGRTWIGNLIGKGELNKSLTARKLNPELQNLIMFNPLKTKVDREIENVLNDSRAKVQSKRMPVSTTIVNFNEMDPKLLGSTLKHDGSSGTRLYLTDKNGKKLINTEDSDNQKLYDGVISDLNKMDGNVVISVGRLSNNDRVLMLTYSDGRSYNVVAEDDTSQKWLNDYAFNKLNYTIGHGNDLAKMKLSTSEQSMIPNLCNYIGFNMRDKEVITTLNNDILNNITNDAFANLDVYDPAITIQKLGDNCTVAFECYTEDGEYIYKPMGEKISDQVQLNDLNDNLIWYIQTTVNNELKKLK